MAKNKLNFDCHVFQSYRNCLYLYILSYEFKLFVNWFLEYRQYIYFSVDFNISVIMFGFVSFNKNKTSFSTFERGNLVIVF